MASIELTKQEIIERTLAALFSIDKFAGRIALRGGQALIAHRVTTRASQDIDLFVHENTITENERILIKEALEEQFADVDMEVRQCKLDHLPAKSEPKRMARIVVHVALQSNSLKKNKQTPWQSIVIEISLSNRMFSLDKINSNGVEMEVSSFVRLVEEKLLSLCQHSPSYTAIHPRAKEQENSLRAKDLFDISTILQHEPETREQVLSGEEIGNLRLLMDDINLTVSDLNTLAHDINECTADYQNEYDRMSNAVVFPEERIDFAVAQKDVLDMLAAVEQKL